MSDTKTLSMPLPNCLVWWQNEGNAAADAEKYSTALHLWDQAVSLTPARAELHEQRAQAGSFQGC